MRKPGPSAASLVLAAALFFATACGDSRNDLEAGLPTDAGNGLYPSISVVTRHGTATAELSLRQVPGGTRFASYQGELSFDPALLSFQSAALPPGVVGAANLASPGHLRFAGTALDGSDGEPLLTLRFAARGTAAKEAFRVSFEEVSRADDFTDLTALVQPQTLLFQSH